MREATPFAAALVAALLFTASPLAAGADAGGRRTLPAGSVLRPLASPVAPPLVTLPAAAEVEVLESDGRWLRVRWRQTVGWFDPQAAPDDGPDGATELAIARAALGDGARSRPIGSFSLLTDVGGPLVDGLDGLATQVAETYAGRYGLPVPGGGPAANGAAGGVVVLFAHEADFRAFGRRLAGDGEGTAGRLHDLAGQTRGRLAALHVAGRGRERVSRLLVHELVHLLNREALGETLAAGPLPPWLDEGLAGDLELFVVTADGRLGAAEPARRDLGVQGRSRPYGPWIALPRLVGEAEVGRLDGFAALASFDRAAFLDPLDGTERYALAAFWVRYLLSGERGELAAPFRAWLATRAAGGGSDAGTLVARLEQEAGYGAERLDAGFRRWLIDLGRRLGLEPRRR